MSEKGTNEYYIAKIKEVKDPIEMLKKFIEYEDFLRGDSYYMDFQDALFDTARKILEGKNGQGTVTGHLDISNKEVNCGEYIEFQEGETHTLLRVLLPYTWQRKCTINMKDKRVRVIYPTANKVQPHLRHSRGPVQGYLWDIYGDDFQSLGIALLALSQAPEPPKSEAELGVIKVEMQK